MVKKLTAALCLLTICLSLSACKMDILPQHNEIEDYEVMKVFGLDKAKDDPSKGRSNFFI